MVETPKGNGKGHDVTPKAAEAPEKPSLEIMPSRQFPEWLSDQKLRPAFVGDNAVMGVSKPRENKTFSGLSLDDALAEKKTEARCALQVVDLRSDDVVHWLRIEGIVEELYDVAVLPDVRRPMAIGFMSDEIRRVISIEDA